MKECFLEADKATLFTEISGTGENILIAFHGFGQNCRAFKSIFKEIENRYTIHSFDIPFHGKSLWKDGDNPITKEYWKQLMQNYLQKHQITSFSIMGYSMGARFVLANLEAFPDKVQEVILIAPDGIKTSFWYNLATFPYIFRRYFRYLILRPRSFFSILHIFSKLKIVDKGVLKFATGQMNSVRKRRKVYYTWMVFKLLSFDMKKIATIINHKNICVKIFLGKYDKIITSKKISILYKRIDNYKLEILETGHNALLEKVAQLYRKQNFKDYLH